MATFIVKFAGVLAAIGASVYCVGPLLPLMLGNGGAWVAEVTALTAVQEAVATPASSRLVP